MFFKMLSRICFLCLGLASVARADDVTVFAAASMKTALDEVSRAYTAQNRVSIRASYAGSALLARQIAQGAPADIYVSANVEWMDWLAEQGRVAERRALLTNRLVLIAQGAAADSPDVLTGESDISAMLGEGRLAMGLVTSVPAGIYGKEALEHLGQWDTLAPQVAQTDNVRAALALVATGEAPLGITYATDALAEPRVHIAGHFPPESHTPILYPVALIDGAGPEARGFYDFLQSDAAASIFAAHGFGVIR